MTDRDAETLAVEDKSTIRGLNCLYCILDKSLMTALDEVKSPTVSMTKLITVKKMMTELNWG